MDSDPQDRARRVNARWSSGPVYLTIRALVRCLLWPYLRTRVTGRENIPPDGPVILAPVHRSNLDSLMLSPLTRRRLRALAKESLFKAPPMAWLMASLGSFPVRRDSADRESMRIARELLAENNLLLVFPEGKRHEGDTVDELFDGTAWLAARTGSTVVPVGIAGTGDAMPTGARLPRPVKVRMVVGPAIDPPEPKASRSVLRAWTVGLASALQAAQDEAVGSRRGTG
ncbi:MAG: lysophospholipid acyltransferase family protein [Acidimicrobiales bacterium]|jgi:1-acyl-sn-glycerol-3-phosphate acyltransferase|nr:lysophospholipid acyltransferase family protein [Acidimicrobiales bacterium]|tara:strand:+ start:312 stop:995 length:684 start_codon:yes stop_codon:yes gene_type:complete